MAPGKGRLWPVDDQGYIQNDASPEQIAPQFKGIIRDIVAAYVDNIGEDIHSIYLTGSVARGRAIVGESDIDAFAVLEYTVDPDLVSQDWIESTEERLHGQHDAVSDVQLELWPQSWIFREPGEFSIFAFIIKTHSVCLWGVDLTPELPDYRVPAVLPAIANDDIIQIKPDIEEAVEEIQADTSPENVVYWCRRISKNMLRAGYGLVMLDVGGHTRDSDLCYQYFAEGYPEQAEQMRRALTYATQPTTNPGEILDFLDRFGTWLITQADRWLDGHNPARHLDYRFDTYEAED